jgi:spoIIIJ-associated protein
VAHAEASARTVEAAVTAAAAQLGLQSDQVDIEVLEGPVPSTFGFIGSPARVRVTPRTTTNTSQVLHPAQPHNPVQAPEPDQAQPAQAAASAAPADLIPASDPTDASSGAASTPDPGAGVLSAPQASDQVPATASGPTTAQEPASSPAGAPSVPLAQPTPVAAEGDQPPAAVAVQGERPSGSTSGAGDPASSIGTQATGPAATTTAGYGSDGEPPATTEPSSSTRPPRRSYRDEPIEPAMVEADTERAGDFLEGLLDALDVDGDITTWVDEVGGHIDLEGPDLDMLVGSNGETLDALQELTRLAVLRQSKRRARLLLDINGFRARQRERLVSVVRTTAEQVIKSQEDHEFQPMTPAERKIVHDAVAAIDGVTTESLGEEPNRRVIIQPT